MDDLYELLKVIFKKEVEEYKYYLGYESDDELDESELEDILYEQCDMNMDQFDLIIERLLPFCKVGQSELSNKVYQGLGKDNIWIIKREV